MRLILTLSIFLLNSCSLNTNSKFWKEGVVKNKENQNKLSKILNKADDITSMTVEEYKIYIDDHTKKSKYPKLNEQKTWWKIWK